MYRFLVIFVTRTDIYNETVYRDIKSHLTWAFDVPWFLGLKKMYRKMAKKTPVYRCTVFWFSEGGFSIVLLLLIIEALGKPR